MPDEDLNADAIYAAFIYLRDYAERDEGEAAFREVMDRRSGKVDFFRSLVKDASEGLEDANVRVHFIPKFEFTPELCEEIFPGEGVEVGLYLAPKLIWGSPAMAESLAQSHGPPGEAVRRFLTDRAH